MSKKHLFLFAIAFFTISYTYSQSIENTVDSLFQVMSDQGESRRGKYVIKFITPFFSSEPDKGLAHLEVIESKAIASKDTIILITCNALYAEYKWRKSDYKAGIEFGMKAIELAESNERFEEELARGMQTVGTIHLFEYNKDEALYYFNKTITIYRKIGENKPAIGLLNNCGVVYMDAADKQNRPDFYDSAIYYFNQVIDQRDESFPSSVMNALGNSGYILVTQKNYEAAKERFDDWLQMENQNPDESLRAMNYGNIGIMYRELGDFEKSNYYFEIGLKHANELGIRFEQMEYYRNLSILREIQKDYKVALELLNRGTIMKDSIFEIEKVNAINELETKYQVEKKEKEVLTAKMEIEKKERLQMFLMIITALVICFSIFTLVWIRQRHNLKQELLSQEINNLRIQINSFLSDPDSKEENLDIQVVNQNLHKPITDREFEILKLAMTNINNREIAEQAFVSVNTVKFHLKNIYIKLGVTNREEAFDIILNKN